MLDNLEDTIKKLKKSGIRFLDGNWGLEKEALRITNNGNLSLTEHPAEFGDKEENKKITVDFSESQLELITPVCNSIEKAFSSISQIHDYAESKIKNELLWPFSMPCRLPEDKLIPIAKFKNKEHEIYRKGLALRYGKKMQMICGLHYNYSPGEKFLNILYKNSGADKPLKEFRNDIYFHTGRNILRYRWLLLYLFGASPEADMTYTNNIVNHFNKIEKIFSCCKDIYSEHKKNTVSIRMSCIGYRNHIPDEHSVSYNSLDEYLTDLKYLLDNTDNTFSGYGVSINNEQVQLNDKYLQKLNEFYSPIRFKQNKQYCGDSIEILKNKGVEYLELRIMDLNPFYKEGISHEDLYFIHIFILYCMFKYSPPINNAEEKIINKNHHATALKGREPGFKLFKPSGDKTTLYKWGTELLNEMKEIACALDSESSSLNYSKSLAAQIIKIENPAILPSSKIISYMEQNNESFIELGVRLAREYMQKEAKYEFSNAGL